MEPIALKPFFLEGSQGRLFCIAYGPARSSPSKGAILYVPPFAEEMNKARKQAALQARKFASLGFTVLIPDLFGTGDSDGDFSAARWNIWRDDLLRGADWLERQQAGGIVLWGVRLGALLAVDLLDKLSGRVMNLLFWQPVVAGRIHLTQFLRLRIAADMLAGKQQESTRDILRDLDEGRCVEVAGYEIHPDLAETILKMELAQFQNRTLPPVAWFELVTAHDRPIPVSSRRVIDDWQAKSTPVYTETVVGEQFWTTPEIAVVPGLIERTSRYLTDGAP